MITNQSSSKVNIFEPSIPDGMYCALPPIAVFQMESDLKGQINLFLVPSGRICYDSTAVDAMEINANAVFMVCVFLESILPSQDPGRGGDDELHLKKQVLVLRATTRDKICAGAHLYLLQVFAVV